MAELEIKNWDNKKTGTVELDDAVFDYPLKQHLIYEAVLAYRAAGRAGTHATKNRKDVSGGGKKPWRQKGTGRARAGDNRSPLWRHGGTVHGPQPRDYSWAMPKKMKRNAIKSVLAQKLRDGQIVCIDSLEVDSHKTKELEARVGGKLGLTEKTLLVPAGDPAQLDLAARNNPRLKVLRPLALNVVDLLHHDNLLIAEPALKELSEVLSR